MPPDRPNQLKIRVSDEEHAMVRALAESQGQTIADYLRLLIRREYAALPPPKKRRP
jgi:hypothetical protein